jgi:hypothetical protein
MDENDAILKVGNKKFALKVSVGHYYINEEGKIFTSEFKPPNAKIVAEIIFIDQGWRIRNTPGSTMYKNISSDGSREIIID